MDILARSPDLIMVPPKIPVVKTLQTAAGLSDHSVLQEKQRYLFLVVIRSALF
jgi:hypothetical protein